MKVQSHVRFKYGQSFSLVLINCLFNADKLTLYSYRRVNKVIMCRAIEVYEEKGILVPHAVITLNRYYDLF